MENFNRLIGEMKQAEENEEKAASFKKTQQKAKGLGAGDIGSNFAAGVALGNPNRKYRVAYGYINDDRTDKDAPLWRDEKYIEAADMDDAMEKYRQHKGGWFGERVPEGRRYIGIQSSDDDFKTLGAKWFWDSQRY